MGREMNGNLEWFHDVLESEFWTIHEGWRLFVRKSRLGGWAWSVQRDGRGLGGFASTRADAERAAIQAVEKILLSHKEEKDADRPMA